MMDDHEDDRLDQSLRDTFSDFDLPPSSHVWRGIEGQLSAMPPPPRTVPLRLLLPAVGLVGVAIGWLLPHPTEQTQKPQPASTAQASIPADSQSMPSSLADNAPSATLPRNTVRVEPATFGSTVTETKRARPVASAATQGLRAAASQLLTSDAVVANAEPAALTEAAPNAVPAASESVTTQPPSSSSQANDSTEEFLAEVSNRPLQDTAAAASSGYASVFPKQSFKNESLREWRPEYRTPKHRLEERGGRLRRIRNSITKHWLKLFAPRHSGQPAS
jgi:hypothetical protein